jgi:CBS domain-containing protein
MKLSDVMTDDPMRVTEADDLALAAQMMAWAGIHHLPVLSRGQGEVVGVLSERDILRHRAQGGRDAIRDPVSAAMSKPAVALESDESLAAAQSLMLSRGIGCIPVVEQGRLVGMLTTADVLRSSLESEIERAATQLPEQVRSVMKSPPGVVAPDSLLFDAVALMVDRRVRHLPVVDAGRRVVGMLSDRDVRTAVGDPSRALEDEAVRERLRATPVSAIMSRGSLTIGARATVPEAARTLVRQDVGALPVVDHEGRLVGIVSYVDVIRALL